MKAFTHLNIYHWFIYLVIGAFALHVNAADITPEEALQIANTFIQKDQTAQKAIRKAPKGTKIAPSIAHRMPSRVATNKDNVYIVNLGNDQGFVVVSGETGTTAEILGYCDHGSFSYEDAPVQFIDLLNEYSAGIDSLRQDPALRNPKPRKVGVADEWNMHPSFLGDPVVGPLITAKWNQTAPYNMFTPDQCYTGCVPTAVAQVMNYWKWPKQSGGQICIGWSQENGFIYEDFPVHTYDWDNMLDDYDHGCSWAQANAVAQLMADVGKAMGTMYCQENGSPTPWIFNALIENFGYELGIESVTGTTAADVMTTLKSELNDKRPVLYAGYPEGKGDGHALVCDGYTKNNYFHFNYGWGGQTNGWYRLSAVPGYEYNVDIWTNVRPYDAVEKAIDGIKYGLLANGTADILDYLGGGVNVENGVLVIPDSVTDPDSGNTYAVTHIRKMAFYRKGDFDKIIVGNNIEAIDPFTFMYTTIDTVVLSDKMEVVPEEAFQLTNIKHLTIGANVKRIGKKAFYLCKLYTIICKSNSVELETESFAHTTPGHGDWEKGIVKINKKAFYGATLSADTYFKNLEVLGDSATYGGRWGGGSPFFRFGPKVREIAITALDGLYSGSGKPVLIVDSLNPYFSDDFYPIIYNKNKTAVIIALSNPSAGWPETIIKMEPGCIRSGIDYTIPQTIVDMEGAFKDCTGPKYNYAELTCPLLVPPVITDATFSDAIFADESKHVYLQVPPGTEELYAEAPGWRRFGDYIVTMYQEFEPLPPQDLNYQMVVHSDSLKTTMPVDKVGAIRVSENEDGEAMVTMSLNGREDISTKATNIDSITFKPGFLYENAEIFDINDSNLTVQAQKCSITFDASVINENAQVCVRNSVLLPRPSEGVTGGIGIDISMLDEQGNAVHELSGVAKITIPFQAPADQAVGAAYYNPQTGEWEPVYLEYNRETGTATILTDHLSFYSLVTFINERTKSELFEALREIPALYAWDEGTKMLLKILDSDDPKVKATIEFKNEMGLWQSLGLDGFYTGAVSISEPLFGFKPEAIDNAVSIMGEIGTAMTILDVVRADLKGDNIGVASGTLKVIMAKTAGAAASWIGTPVMAASMSLVAFIGVALEKFGTTVQEFKADYFRTAYRYYYSMEGYRALSPDSRYNNDVNGNAKPHGYFRTPKDWYDYFYPAFVEANMSEQQLNAYIQQSVRVYCDQFWTETADLQTWAFVEARTQGFQSFWDATDALKQQISDEYYADLMNGTLTAVFAALRNKQIVQANNRAVAKINSMVKWMNKKVAFRIVDSSWEEGKVSKFAGRMIGFAAVPDNVADQDAWRKPIGEDGKVPLGWFTTYALVRNMMPFQITLFDENGVPEKVFDFQLDGVADKTIIDIDLATQGVKADTKQLEDLKLDYTPDSVLFRTGGYDYVDQYDPEITGELVYMDEKINFYRNKVRWCTELDRFFNRHDFITVDSLSGNFTIGDDIAGKLVGDSATGTFTINTDYRFFIQTAQQWLDNWNNKNVKYYDKLLKLLNGSVKHQLTCQYVLKRKKVDDHYEYDITYTGEGIWDLTPRYITYVGKTIDWSAVVTEDDAPVLTMDEIGIGTDSKGGEVTLEYKTTLK
ncbi:MAG: C10 family peptidase [Paludibacteraceae bacterium]|nr:C10 family peptidase [Paludibacteraceae bacterium]